MHRRHLLKFVGASLFATAFPCHSAFGRDTTLSDTIVCPSPQGPKPNPPFPPRPVSGIHSHIHRPYSAYSYAELANLIKHGSSEFVIASGISDALEISGWTGKHLYSEDILIWTRKHSDIDNIAGETLKERISKQNGVYLNTQEEKFAPIAEWMKHIGIDLENSEEWAESGFGISGYHELERIALEHENPLIIGLRGMLPDSFRPVTVDGFAPIISEGYPLRKPVYGYFRDEKEACEFWRTYIQQHQMEELMADKGIFKQLGGDVDGNGWLKWSE